ncbi:MAG: HEAT repeat domain-containing protein [Planctomycetota bacterium]|nr:HEAT repeat domain-containing protein [Planctomycetota bacterium]
MISDASEDAGGENRTEGLLKSLGEPDWSIRQEAVRGLLSDANGDTIERLFSILREGHRDLSRLNSAIQILVGTSVDIVPELLQLLTHPDAEVRSYTALTLGERGDPRAISGLLGALPDSDTNVRMHAVEALGRLRAASAVDALIELVEAMDFELAFPAIDALIAIGDERIAHRLLPLLKDSIFKGVAVEALGALGNEEFVNPLLELLADADVRPAEIASAITRIHERYSERYGDEVSISETVRALASPANIQSLVAAVPISSSAGASSGLQIVSWLSGSAADLALVNLLDRPPIDAALTPALTRRGPSIVPLLLSRMATSTDDAQKTIIAALAGIGDRTAVPALLQRLDPEGDVELLTRIVDALARLSDSRAYQPLRSLLGHRSVRVRQSAVAAVSALGHLDTAADLLPEFHNPSPLVRESCVRVAAYLGLPLCLDSVFHCCDDPDERVRRAAIECLPNFDDSRVYPRLSQAIRTDMPMVRAAAAGALSKLDDETAAADLLANTLQDGDVWVRYFAVRSLVSIQKPEQVIDLLLRLATDDPAMQVRVAAIEALGECGPVVLPILLKLSNSGMPDLANAALHALGSFPQPDAKQILLEAIQSQDFDRQTQAVRALARASCPELIEPLRNCILGKDDRLAAEAAISLSQFRLPKAATALIEGASLPARRNDCIAALTRMSADAAVPSLARGLLQCNLDTRRAIVEALSRIRSAEAIDALETALEDRQASVRFAALSALAHIRKIRRPTMSTKAGEGRN